MKSLFLVSLLLLGVTVAARPVEAADVRVYVRHEVNDYATWRKGYDAFNAERKGMGVTGASYSQILVTEGIRRQRLELAI